MKFIEREILFEMCMTVSFLIFFGGNSFQPSHPSGNHFFGEQYITGV